MKRALGLTLLLLIVAGAVALGWEPLRQLWLGGAASGPLGTAAGDRPAAAVPARPTAVSALGRIEPAGGVITLGGLPGDRVTAVAVEPGAAVKQGDLLVEFESYQLREAELKLAQLQLDEARRRREIELDSAQKLIAEARLGIDALALAEHDLRALEAKRALVEANLAVARRDLARLKALDASIVAPQQLERAQLLVDQAEGERTATVGALEKLRRSTELSRQQAELKLQQAEAGPARIEATIPLASMELAVDVARRKAAQARLTAPFDGYVVRFLVNEGDTVASGPVVQLANTAEMIVVAEVYETDARFVSEGQSARITSDALSAPLSGTVEHVSRLIGRNEVMSLRPSDPADRRVAPVRIRLAEPALAARWIHLQVDVTIQTGGAAPVAEPSQPRGADQARHDRR